jgi:hypothetical protein
MGITYPTQLFRRDRQSAHNEHETKTRERRMPKSKTSRGELDDVGLDLLKRLNGTSPIALNALCTPTTTRRRRCYTLSTTPLAQPNKPHKHCTTTIQATSTAARSGTLSRRATERTRSQTVSLYAHVTLLRVCRRQDRRLCSHSHARTHTLTHTHTHAHALQATHTKARSLMATLTALARSTFPAAVRCVHRTVSWSCCCQQDDNACTQPNA